MTDKQARQFNMMLSTLRKIAKDYMTPEKLRKNSEKMYGLEFEECIEMVYENIQGDALYAIKGIKYIEIKENEHPQREDNTP
jgi:hypothetical protein